MIIAYKKISYATIRKEEPKIVKQISKWFKDNPNRKICRAQLWYDNFARIRRGFVKEDIRTAAIKAYQK